METISITIPREKEALIKTADYLRDLASVETAAAMKPVITEELNPEAEAEAMGQRIDDTVTAAQTQAAPEFDKEGIRWDARIHASSKALVADGTWRLKRGVDQALIAQVKAELKQGEEPVVAEIPATPPLVPPAAPVAAVLPAAVAPPVPPVEAAATVTYSELVPMITEAVQAKKLQPTDILEACKASGAHAQCGAASLPDLAKAEAAPYISLVADALRNIWATRV